MIKILPHTHSISTMRACHTLAQGTSPATGKPKLTEFSVFIGRDNLPLSLSHFPNIKMESDKVKSLSQQPRMNAINQSYLLGEMRDDKGVCSDTNRGRNNVGSTERY